MLAIMTYYGGLQPNMPLKVNKSRRKQYPKLTKEQRQLVLDNIWVARSRAADMTRSGEDLGCLTFDDFVQICTLGLCRAAVEYDPDKGVKFSTYAYLRVMSYAITAIRDTGHHVKMPRKIYGNRCEVKRLLKEGKSCEDVAAITGLTVAEVAMCEESWRSELRDIDETYDDGEGGPTLQLEYKPPFKSKFGDAALRVIAKLTETEQAMLERYLQGNYTDSSWIKRAETLLETVKAELAEASDYE